jgi:ribosomal protein S18 acetylase RimI-like enzyme
VRVTILFQSGVAFRVRRGRGGVVLALGVLSAYRRRCLATRLVRIAAASLRVLAANAPQVPTSLIYKQSPTRV